MSKPDKKATDKPEEAKPATQETKAEAKPEANELQAKLDEMKDVMMRALADAENTRKRALKEVEDSNRYGVSTLAKDLIPVLESLQRAVDTAPLAESQATKDFIEGINLTRKELVNIFERRGIKRIEPKAGEKFDHNFHQAVAQIEDHKIPAGGVLQVVQSGYVIHDRLLRPAMVTVSKGASSEPKVDTTV